MSRLIEHDIIQNIGIGALALHTFANSYFKTKENLNGPSLANAMPVLPLLYHEDTLHNIYKRALDGGFFNAISGYREISAGLQQRMENMADQTFKSLNLAYQTKILTYNKELNEILPIENIVETKLYGSDIKKINQGAHRVGIWFASLPFDQVCIMLKIKF
ncbi:MAG: hypothetical protein IPL31_10455 [Saprospiraceae bacterium]|nr:hypothetical protein [Saprospiraceae bacterium]